MPEYISNGKLFLGIYNIKGKLVDVLRYLYTYFTLDHDKMMLLYKNIIVTNDFDDFVLCQNADEHDKMRDTLEFNNYKYEDDKYIYKYETDIIKSAIDNGFIPPCAKKDMKLPDNININAFKYKTLIRELHNYFKAGNSPKDLRIVDYDTLVMRNCHGINKDARGVRELDWKLYFWDRYIRFDENGISMHDLIISVFKVSSHKFDKNYEAYGGIDKLKLGDGVLCVYINLMHGS